METELRKWIEKDGVEFLREIGVKKGQAILDFGCGEGHYTIPASKVAGGDGKIYALDKDRNALEKLKTAIRQGNMKNIELINKNSKIPLGNESVDAVLFYDVIHYSNRKEREVLYNEVNRVLKKKGLFSVYPKHHKKDYPLDELADMDLEDIIKEIEKSNFILQGKFLKRLLHDDYYNEGYVLNLRRC